LYDDDEGCLEKGHALDNRSTCGGGDTRADFFDFFFVVLTDTTHRAVGNLNPVCVSLHDVHTRDAASSHTRSRKPTSPPPARRTYRVKVWCVPRSFTAVEDPMFVDAFLGFVVAPVRQIRRRDCRGTTHDARARERAPLSPSGVVSEAQIRPVEPTRAAVSHREDGSCGECLLC
jgi:hypothetical protein